MTLTDIVANIDRRLAEVQVEIGHLHAARTALIDRPEPVRAPSPRRARHSSARPAYDVVPAGKLTALLANSDGMRTRDLAAATNGDPVQVLSLLKEQETVGAVRRTGSRAATRWHAITDEDRIAARAAELEGQRRGRRARKN
jgi:hypothetical protein